MSRSLSLGPLATIVFRAVVVLAALIVTAASSLVLVRRLDAASYAIYQTLTRRASIIASFPLMVLGLWIYRYVAQGVKGSIEAGVLVSIASGAFSAIVGLTASWALRLDPATSLLASAALGAFLLYNGLLAVLNAARPLKYSIVIFIYRLSYSLGVIALVYFLREGLAGALSSLLAAALAASTISLSWLKGRVGPRLAPSRKHVNLVIEWVKGSPAAILLALGTLLMSLDVAVAYALTREDVVAAYFVIRIPFAFAIEAFTAASTYLTGFLLGGGDVSRAVLSMRLTLLLVAFASGFVAVNPGPVVYLLNPSYYWAVGAIIVMSATAYLDVFTRMTLNTLTGSVKGGIAESHEWIKAIGVRVMAANTAYLALEAAALRASENPESQLLAWVASYTATRLLLAALLVSISPADLRRAVRGNLSGILGYPVAALAASLPFKAEAYHARFWLQAEALLPSATASLALYAAILALLDPFFRQVLKGGFRYAREIFNNYL